MDDRNIYRTYMSNIIVVLTVFYTSAVSNVVGSGEFVITHHPQYLNYVKGANSISTSEISSLISSTYGFSLHKDLNWDGLQGGSVFRRPKANVLFSVEGHNTFRPTKDAVRYSTVNDVPEVDTESVVNHIESSASDQQPLVVDFSVDNTVFDVRSRHPALFGSLPATYVKIKEAVSNGLAGYSVADLGSLNMTQDVDMLFLGELHVIQQVVNAVKFNSAAIGGASPNFFHFKVMGLKKLKDTYGADSKQVQDAIALLETLVQKVTEDFRDMYNGNVIVQVVMLDNGDRKTHSRKSRSLLADPSPSPTTKPEPVTPDNINRCDDHDDDYAVIFNIILWGLILLAVATFAVSYGMWNMDPGRDSIIYRMTTQRIKKD